MNRKKITLLLTGLAIASSMFMGCSSSNNNNSSNGSGNVAQENGGLRRATDRTVTDYNGDRYQADGTYGQYPATNYQENGYSYPNVAYADDITGIDNGNGVMSGIGGETNNAQYIDDNYTGNNGTNNVGINGGNTPNTNPSVGVSDYSMIDSNDPVGNSNISGYSMDDAQTPMNGLNGFGDTTEDYGTNNNMVPRSSLSEANSGNGVNESLPNIVAPGVGGAVEGLGEIPHTSTQQGTTDTNITSDTTQNNGTNTTTGYDNTNNGTSTNSYGNTDVALNNNSTDTNGVNNRNGYENNSDVNDPNMSGYNAGVTGRSVADTNAGKMTVLRSVGGVELTGSSGSKKPQGTIQVSFTLSGDVLSTEISSASNATLDTLIQNAYSETLADANNNYSGTATTTDREKLQGALKEILDSTGDIKILLQDSKGQTVTLPFNPSMIAPAKSANSNYVRHIIDLDGMNSRSAGYSTKASSSDIPVSIILRNGTVDNSGNDELLTDTTYTFIGLSGSSLSESNILPIKDNKYLTGFNIPSCTTGKAPSTLEVKSDGSTNVVYSSDNFESSSGSAESGTVYTTAITNKIYVDTETYVIDNKPENFVAGGTNIKLKNFIFKDPDDSIKSIEVEDKDGKKYPCSLVYVDPQNESKGEYLEIDGLTPETGYTFKNIYVTSNLSGEDEVDTIQLRKKGSSKVEENAKVYSTIAFTEPKVELGANGPKQMVTLPGGLKVQAVKNDSTVLRYILKVDNSNGNIGDLRVNSLRSGEESKIQKIVDKKTNTNYYIVTLSNLTPGTDYNFVTLELDYTDFDNKAGVSRVSLAQINSKTGDKTVDNVTEDKPVTGNTFAVDVITENKADYPRSASLPIFIDDMNNRFVRMDYTVTGDNKDNVKAVYDGVDTLQVTGLTPNKQTTLNLSFVYTDDNGQEKELKKYVQITTPRAGDVDIMSDTATVSGNEAKIQLAYNGDPKSKIKSVVVKDENGKEIGSAWDPQTNTITLKGLDSNKDYSGLVATFTLENTNKVNYPLTSFSTKDEIVKPTGPVANFVQRVYTIALGREPEVTGWNFWIDKLQKKEITATEFIAENLMTQKEFVEKELNKQQFVTTMYTLIVNREPDEEGQKYWEGKYDEYRQGITSIEQLRIKIAREMMDQPEFKELVSSIGLKY